MITSVITSLTAVDQGEPALVNESTINPHKLTLALEPESAAIYCRQLGKEMLANYSDKLTNCQPNCYMIVDAGGGTIDIVVHQVADDGNIKSIMPPTGNSHGGMEVNEKFSQLLEHLTGDTNFESFLNKKKVHKAILASLLFGNFEDTKVRFGEKFCTDEGRSLNVRLDSKFVKHYKEINITAAVQSMNNPNIKYMSDDDVLKLSYPYVHKEMFKPVVDQIVQSMVDTIRAAPAAIEAVYLVGGFGGSHYVCQMVRQALAESFEGQKIDLIVPRDHTLAVSHGAVMYRQEPKIIITRVPDANYGVAVEIPFKCGVHDEHYLTYDKDDGSKLCANVFCLFVEKGKPVHYNEVFVTSLVPNSKSDTIAKLCFCSSFQMVQYTKTKQGKYDVDHIGTATVAVPSCGLPKSKRIIKISMCLGGTELQATGKYLPTGEEVRVVLDFLSTK